MFAGNAKVVKKIQILLQAHKQGGFILISKFSGLNVLFRIVAKVFIIVTIWWDSVKQPTAYAQGCHQVDQVELNC